MSVSEEFLTHLTTKPGVYMMKDAKETVIYIGKAKSLRSRVRSYFRDSGDGRHSVPFLRSRIETIETIVTDTEKEALLLENTLIKKHKPRYNIRLRDDKTYLSLRFVLNHKWPRVHPTRRRRPGDKAVFFGPYSSSKSLKETMRFLQRLFPIRSCSDRELESRVRPCILHQIDRCCAPCVKKVDEDLYQSYVDQSMLFLKGQKDEVMSLLQNKMMEYSESMEFEKAALIRDQMGKLRLTVEEQKAHTHRAFNRDVISFARDGGKICFAVLNFKQGKLENSSSFTVRDTNMEDPAIMEGFVSQYYDTSRDVPLDVLVSVPPDNSDFLTSMLSDQRDGPVHIRFPQRGEKKRLMELATKNANATLERVLAGQKTIRETLENLQKSLHLPRLPKHIECFDISNFQGSFPVGSMVCFQDGEPYKAGYKRFRIKTVKGQNDFAMMQEVLTRKYTRVMKGEEDTPDLIVIDGGIAQLNVAVEVLKQLNLYGKIPVVGMAKSRRKGRSLDPHAEKTITEERLFLPNRKNPITFRRSDPALRLLEHVRDETHRFGVKYHRLLRDKQNLKTGLEEIQGLGPKRHNLLMEHFVHVQNIRDASVEELKSVAGIPEDVLQRVHDHFHGKRAQRSPDQKAAEIDDEPDTDSVNDDHDDVDVMDENDA